MDSLIKEFGLFVWFEMEDEAAWEDAQKDGFAQVHPLWDQTSEHAKLKICRDYRKIAGY